MFDTQSERNENTKKLNIKEFFLEKKFFKTK